MKKFFLLLIVLALLAAPAFSIIKLDQDDSDWADLPLLLEAVDNVDGYFPSEVGAAVTDIVDVKEVKATIVGNVMYFMIRFQGGPAWPNMADQGEYEGVPINRSRGYYHLLLDLDNDVTSGWDSHYYEAHYTPVGYLASQSMPNTDPIGADTYLMWGCQGWKTPPHPDSGGIKNSGIRQVEYYSADVSEIDSKTDAGADYDIFWNEVSNPDSAKAFAWNGTLPVMESDDATLVDGRYYWMGHAWGSDFLEMGVELTMIQKYWENKGMDYFNMGDIIGVAAMIETPADDWGVDMTPRGEFACPEIPVRPNGIDFDGDDADWEAQSLLLEAVDNVDGYFPSEVGAAVTDIVDVKEVKAFVNDAENAIYWFVRFQGGPAWPNMADQGEYEGVPINRSRGYYHLLLDLDNDVTTGWDSHYYEAHYTPVGYLASQSMPNTDPIGADTYLMWGCQGWKTPPHPDSGGIKNSGIRQVEYYAADVSEIDSKTDAGADYDIYWNEVTDPDSAKSFMHDGMLPCMESDDASLVDDMVYFNAHAWGFDFLEMGQSLGLVKKYWSNKLGVDVLKPGDVIGVAAMIETPMDDWGVDMTPRGQFTVGGGAAVDNANSLLAKKFVLEENYPNPFNPVTNIKYSVPNTAEVKLVIYNALGQKVRTLVEETKPAGNYQVKWNGRNDLGQLVSSGVYIYKLTSGSTTITKKMNLLK
ncbi:T9SS type A sorting domain-containing protein [candidate division KSB1 bacterium]|nr:T9SS type A sorting domain-containing protein [candidate division KSB1 bacterium]